MTDIVWQSGEVRSPSIGQSYWAQQSTANTPNSLSTYARPCLTHRHSDIAFNIPGDEILSAFKEIWNIPLSHGSKVLALTVPKATIDGRNASLVERRNNLNKMIKDHNADNL